MGEESFSGKATGKLVIKTFKREGSGDFQGGKKGGGHSSVIIEREERDHMQVEGGGVIQKPNGGWGDAGRNLSHAILSGERKKNFTRVLNGGKGGKRGGSLSS